MPAGGPLDRWGRGTLGRPPSLSIHPRGTDAFPATVALRQTLNGGVGRTIRISCRGRRKNFMPRETKMAAPVSFIRLLALTPQFAIPK